jgi:hypothetical protein
MNYFIQSLVIRYKLSIITFPYVHKLYTDKLKIMQPLLYRTNGHSVIRDGPEARRMRA